MVPAMRLITTPIAKYPGIPKYVEAIAAEKIVAIPTYVAGALIFSARNSRPTIAVIGHAKRRRIPIIAGLSKPGEFCDCKKLPSVDLEILSEI